MWVRGTGFCKPHHKSKQINLSSSIILKYCKLISSLPNSIGPLSEKKSSKAIELANAEVEKNLHLNACACKIFYLLATNNDVHFF